MKGGITIPKSMTTRGAIAIAGEKFKMIVAETMIRKM